MLLRMSTVAVAALLVSGSDAAFSRPSAAMAKKTRGRHDITPGNGLVLQQQSESCTDAYAALLNTTTCYSVSETVLDVENFDDVAAVAEEACAACNVDAFEPVVDAYRAACRGQPAIDFFLTHAFEYEFAVAALLMCGDDNAECYRQAYFREFNAAVDDGDVSICKLSCGREYFETINIDTEQCGGVSYDERCPRISSEVDVVDSLQGIACSQDELLLALNPDLGRVEDFCQSETGCSDRYLDLEGRRQAAGCSVHIDVNECTDARLGCFADESGNNCWMKELEAFGEDFSLTSATDNACGIDRVSGEANCNEACREFVDEQVAEFGCCFSSLLNTCPDGQFSGESHTTLQLLQDVCSYAVPDVCTQRDIGVVRRPGAPTPGSNGASAAHQSLVLVKTVVAMALIAKAL